MISDSSASSTNKPGWTEFVVRARRLTRMYTYSGSLLEVAALLIGFDNGIGEPSVLDAFQGWMSQRHPERGEMGFPILVLHEITDDHDTKLDPRNLTPDQNRTAAATLLDLMHQFLAERDP
jgi:hypothetical protein